jgi:hypothetical protein
MIRVEFPTVINHDCGIVKKTLRSDALKFPAIFPSLFINAMPLTLELYSVSNVSLTGLKIFNSQLL